MARAAAVKEKQTKVAGKRKEIHISDEVFLYFKVKCEWISPILGVAPMGSTLEEHVTHLLEEEEDRIRGILARRRASERVPPQAVVGNSKNESLDVETDETEVEVLRELSTTREQLRRRTIQDPRMDKYTKETIERVVKEIDEAERIIRKVLRATNTFYRHPNGNLACRAQWLGGCKKSTLRDFFGYYPDQTNRIARCITIYPPFVDLGTREPDGVHDANIPLQGGGRGEAQATIKRFHLVDPRLHGSAEFFLIFKILNSALTGTFVEYFPQALEAMGGIGVGGSRPDYGLFEPLEWERLSQDEGKGLTREMRPPLFAGA